MEKVGVFWLRINLISLLVQSSRVSFERQAIWPAGEYSLPKPMTGCPDDSWKEGWLRQEMENDDINDKINVKSKFSSNFHMNASIFNGIKGGQYEFIDREFCTKILALGNKTTWKYWPKGKYCIYQKNDCPYDMDEGWIQLDDEDNFDGVNRNKHRGILPKFSQSISNLGATRLFYCCQTEGQWYNPVELPTEKPFYLLPYKTPNCQRVLWTVSSLEYIVYDTENDVNGDKFFGHHVYTNKVKSLPKIFYCYYAGCRYELHGNTGLFSSPYLNNSFYDFHSCSWAIKVNLTLKISVVFKQLFFIKCQHNSLAIYAGQSENSSMLLAVYCGRNATSRAQINSTTNELFIVMKHRQTNSSTPKGFGFTPIIQLLQILSLLG
ncbi:uncharacterized protein LOC124436085 [Xenia sp. Carnegie-2017]|uniref:uncharacterized protein LOC124436085 n=1 Tax=Xenia sp. Carnegie-2017 TaxID=2897299 RepID=UPI001F04E9DA|nr:uncharacterized protein LOC124436085 [Xenia sp. Carnegie-2017]XP_046842078.1 uncharacterized protein LOC124436085 [Xenia sp. Carnegie-2017]